MNKFEYTSKIDNLNYKIYIRQSSTGIFVIDILNEEGINIGMTRYTYYPDLNDIVDLFKL